MSGYADVLEKVLGLIIHLKTELKLVLFSVEDGGCALLKVESSLIIGRR